MLSNHCFLAKKVIIRWELHFQELLFCYESYKKETLAVVEGSTFYCDSPVLPLPYPSTHCLKFSYSYSQKKALSQAGTKPSPSEISPVFQPQGCFQLLRSQTASAVAAPNIGPERIQPDQPGTEFHIHCVSLGSVLGLVPWFLR